MSGWAAENGLNGATYEERFLLYRWMIQPFVGHILRATLRQIRANAEAPRRACAIDKVSNPAR
jgi:hypothetical protein